MFEHDIKLVPSSGLCGRKDWRATISAKKGPCFSDRLSQLSPTAPRTPRVHLRKGSPSAVTATIELHV
ncbi:hypothetical protein IG631_16476 [Alternaria alternata]|nr:hypothetical protein IG631_16476 [Alternaria alternata]